MHGWVFSMFNATSNAAMARLCTGGVAPPVMSVLYVSHCNQSCCSAEGLVACSSVQIHLVWCVNFYWLACLWVYWHI